MCRVLVIDDEEDVLRAVKRRLERDDQKVMTASSAEEGTDSITNSPKPFDVIITDMSMENSHAGLKVLQAAFSRDLFAQVIVMTAYGNVANAVECMRRGAFDYIEKNNPEIDVYEALSNKVHDAMDQRRRDMHTVALWERAAKALDKTH